MKKILLLIIFLLIFSVSGFCSLEWLSPTSFDDPDTAWSSEDSAYDEGLETAAESYNGTDRTWGSFIELGIDTVLCRKIRFYAELSADITEIDVDLYYRSAWNDVYEGVYSNQTWVEIAEANYQYVTKARVRFFAKKAATAYLYEFDFEHYTFEPPASVAHVNIAEFKTDGGTSITMSAPAGTSVDDLLIAYISKDDDVDIDETGGYGDFTMLYNNIASGQNCLYLAWRIADAGDAGETPTEYTWNGDSEDWLGEILCYSGADPNNPIHASGIATGDSATPTAPSVAFTDLTVGSLVLQVMGIDSDDNDYVTPAQLTERFNAIQAADIGGAGGDTTVYGKWTSPTGFTEGDWTDESNTYDESTSTDAEIEFAGDTWSPYIELTCSAISCSKVRFYADYGVDYINQISVDVYYSSAWHNIYEGAFAHREWVEKEIGSIQTVTAMRMKFYNDWATQRTAYIREVDFYEVIASGTGSISTAVFTATSRDWAAATLVIEAAAEAGWSHKFNTATISKWNGITFSKWNGLE